MEGPAAGAASMSIWRKSSRLEPAENAAAMGGSTIMVVSGTCATLGAMAARMGFTGGGSREMKV